MIAGVDGNYYLHRAFSVKGEFDPEHAVARTFLSLVFADLLAVKATQVVIVFDGAKGFRYKLDPNYKINRDSHKENAGDGQSTRLIYTKSLPYLQGILTMLEIPWEQHHDLEGDDLLSGLGHAHEALEDSIALLGRDKDMHQCLRPGVRIYDAQGGGWFTHKDVVKKWGVKPSQMVMLQAIMGDSSDDIPGVPKVGPKTAARICNEFSSISEWIKGETNEKLKVVARKMRKRLLLNKKLVALRTDHPPHPHKIAKTILDKDFAFPSSLKSYINYLYPKTKSLF